ncbi:hypothetical protein Naga_101072g2 [Nannochloropsis gaditana]|uniref:Uncharacterized protein n=1 Tax=Nannochloropsis gaditana TaxID=72520 RepID=W7TJG6_9STRA|nr:hypothetical protein Naga_101072g2 [Nannochloropsis gaditana]
MKPEFWPGPGAGQRAARGLANESILAMYALFGGTRPTGYALFDAPHPTLHGSNAYIVAGFAPTTHVFPAQKSKARGAHDRYLAFRVSPWYPWYSHRFFLFPHYYLR